MTVAEILGWVTSLIGTLKLGVYISAALIIIMVVSLVFRFFDRH